MDTKGSVLMSKLAIILGGELPQHLQQNSDLIVFENKTMIEAVSIARDLESRQAASAFICTAGVAHELENIVSMPIIKSDPTYFDLLETLVFAENQSNMKSTKIALVLHQSRSTDIDPNRLQAFLNNKLCLFTYSCHEDIPNILSSIAAQDIKLLVAGPTAFRIGTEMGIRSFMLNIGEESLSGAINKAHDILEVISIERENNILLQNLFNLFHDGIVATDNRGIILECNQMFSDFFNQKRHNLLGKPIEDVTKDSSWFQVYKNGAAQNDRLINEGKYKLFSSRQPIIVDNEIKGVIGTFRDTNQIEKLEHRYRKHQAKGLVARMTFNDVIGESSVINKTVERAKAFSATDSPVLIEGETGTGKELFAQSIHNQSSRNEGPFVALNCAALPENLLESELMGYEEGAFTGAKKGGKAGLFELAHRGTIFLDEINQMPINLQARLLRVLQEKQILRLGGERIVPIDARIIVATNENLKKLIEQGKFREDLYYRLNVLTLNTPSLKNRHEDIRKLIEYYFQVYSSKHGHVKTFSDKIMERLVNYNWPGNVRELSNFVEQYVILGKHLPDDHDQYVSEYLETQNRISAEDKITTEENAIYVEIGTLFEMETQLIEEVLKIMNGNKVQTARFLDISRTTLWKIRNRKI
ncbi:MAG: PAS domain-containing protein [Tindallia sp. MSAO_Bac2]|nr:MAG: PAS domain-containing protein [Tindallia sp. MSAO_Bac2]